MSNLVAELSAEVGRFLDGERTDVQRIIHRAAVVNMDGTGVTIEQHKFVTPEEMKLIRAQGARALATTVWFNDVEWLQGLSEKDLDENRLWLDAEYPMSHFSEPPVSGVFAGSGDDRRWLEQYGSISGFGNGGKITTYVPRFVRPGEHAITELVHPNDPTALDAYNTRYKQYMADLDGADVAIGYRRAWDVFIHKDREDPPRTLGKLSLAGLSLEEVLLRGMFSEDEVGDFTSIVLHDEPQTTKYVGKLINIVDGEATVEPYWDGAEAVEPASDKLLEIALELVSKATEE